MYLSLNKLVIVQKGNKMKLASSTLSLFLIHYSLVFRVSSFPKTKSKETVTIEKPRRALPFAKQAHDQSLDTSTYLFLAP